jgi:hypothetical protein
MGQHAEVALPLARGIGPAAQGRAEQTFVPREGALRLPALAVFPFGKALLHLPAVARLGPLPSSVAAVDGNGGRADVQVLTAEAVVLFAVERRIGQHPMPGDSQGRLLHRGTELRGIVARAEGDGGGGEEVAAGVAGDGQLRPGEGGLLAAGPREEVVGSVAAFEAGGIDGRLGLLTDQAALLGARGGLEEERNGLPFFSSRRAA